MLVKGHTGRVIGRRCGKGDRIVVPILGSQFGYIPLGFFSSKAVFPLTSLTSKVTYP